MDLSWTVAEEAFRASICDWLEAHLPAVRGDPHPSNAWSETEEYAMRRRFDQALYRAGWAGLTWPERWGGRQATWAQQYLFWEECARHRAPELFNRLGLGIIGPLLMTCGRPDQHDTYLPATLAGEVIWCQGFSEPNAGSDLANIGTLAHWDAGHWVVSGHKVWITLAQYATHCLLLARSEAGSSRHHGLTMFIVPMNATGVTVKPIRQINGFQEFNAVYLDHVQLEESAVVGSVGKGWAVAMETLKIERGTNFIGRQVRLGVELENLLAELAHYPESMDAAMKDRLVDLRICIEALHYTVRRRVAQLDRGQDPQELFNATKIFWSQTHQALTSWVLEWAQGFVDWPALPDPVRSYLSARAESIYAGTNEIQRNIVGERLLGLPR